MNRLLFLCCILLGLSSCKGLERAGGSGHAFHVQNSIPPQYSNTLGEWDARVLPSSIASDSVEYLPYLGEWEGEAYIHYSYPGAPVLDGIYHLDLDIRANSWASATTDAISNLNLIQKISLKILLQSRLRNMDWENNNFSEGEVIATAAHWIPTPDPNIFQLHLDVKENMETYQVRFQGRDQMVFMFEENGSPREIILFRK